MFIYNNIISLNYPILNSKQTVSQKKSGCDDGVYIFTTFADQCHFFDWFLAFSFVAICSVSF